MPISALQDPSRRKIGTDSELVSSVSKIRLLPENGGEKRKRNGRCFGIKSPFRKRLIPWASLVALIVTWSGLFLFCWKMYVGLLNMETITGGFFQAAAHYLRIGREVIVMLGIVMAALTGSMVFFGFFATLHADRSYHGRKVTCWSICCCRILGNRLWLGILWCCVYIFNLIWLAILSALVLMTSAYFCFLPICLPQSGRPEMLCFNFSLVVAAISGGGTTDVSLLLCGGAIDKFCKLTKAIVPWYWGAYGGCVAVLVGLSHFNGSLAANYAHVKHAIRYQKIRRRTRKSIEWSKGWRVKSVLVDPSDMISTVTGSAPTAGRSYEETSNDDDSSNSGSDFDAEERRRLTPRPRTTSNGSIIVHRRSNSDGVFCTSTSGQPPPYSTNSQYRRELRV